MEQIVVVTGHYPLSNNDMWEVNNYLANGWTVKSVTPQNTKDYMTVIFVLEKGLGTPCNIYAGKYESKPLHSNVTDYIILNTNGTFTWSLYGGGEGHWTSNGDTLTIMPNNCAPPINCNYYANECGNIIIVNGRSFTKKL